MVGGLIFNYDFVRQTVANVSDVFRDVAWGHADWEAACRHLTRSMPGSAVSILNYDIQRRIVNGEAVVGIEPPFVQSYLEHYVRVNPWLDFWANAPSGVVRISEREFPARSFSMSEFYADWLAPQESMEAAVGLRLDVDAGSIVHLAWHYGLDSAASNDQPAAAILEGLRPAIAETVRTAAMIRDAVEMGARGTGLVDHIAGAAIIIDRRRRIHHANAEASAWLTAGDALTAGGDILTLRESPAQKWLEEAVLRIALGEDVPAPVIAVRSGRRILRLSATRISFDRPIGAASLLPPQPLILVVARMLPGEGVRLDHHGLRFAFGLSAAELRLCEILMEGRSLVEAATVLGVSDGTVRQRIKLIFQKTRTHRQGELVALLARFQEPGPVMR